MVVTTSPTAAPDQLLTVSEVARTLHLSRAHAYRLIKSGELEAIRLGRGPGRAQLIRLHPDTVVGFIVKGMESRCQ